MAGDLPAESKEEIPYKASLEQSLDNLTIQKQKPDPDISRLVVSKTKPASTSTKKEQKKTKKKEVVADSWEDEISSSGGSSSEDETEKEEVTSTTARPGIVAKSEGPLAPPPTPAPNTFYNVSTPTTPSTSTYTTNATTSSSSLSDRSARAVRPEKQTAVASRMIAGALGIRAPKRTEEQRAYDRAMKEQEIKRRNRAKEEEAKARQEEERAKAAVWDA